MTKLTPEQVEMWERDAERQKAAFPSGHFTKNTTHDPDTILTLCREWRGRGEVMAVAAQDIRNGAYGSARRLLEEALKGADDDAD